MPYKNHFHLLLCIIVSLFILSVTNSCTKTPSSHTIVTFTLENPDGTPISPDSLQVIMADDSIKIYVPADVDITRLIPVITIEGKEVSPRSGQMQDFSNPILYTVTGNDGNSSSYIVVVYHVNPIATIFVGSSDNNFYALNAMNGKPLWKHTSSRPFSASRAAYDNGTVYVGGIDDSLYAFDAVNGKVRWQFFAGNNGIESDVIFEDGVVYTGSNDHNLYAVNACTGKLKWKYTTGANVSSSPVVSQGTVYFGSSDNKIYALNADNGQFRWSYATSGMINQSGIALANGILYVGSRDGHLYAIDKNNGQLKWSFSTDGISVEQSSPVVADSIVYFGSWVDLNNFSRKGCLYAVNAKTGVLIWKQPAIKEVDSDPLVAEGRLFVTSGDGILYAVDRLTGDILWQKTILSNGASPAVHKDTLYVGGGGTRNIYAFNTVTGDEIWHFPVRGLMTSTPLFAFISSRVNKNSSCEGDNPEH